MEETELLVQFIRENQACFYRVAYSYVKESQTAMDLVQGRHCKGVAEISHDKRCAVAQTVVLSYPGQ